LLHPLIRKRSHFSEKHAEVLNLMLKSSLEVLSREFAGESAINKP